MSTTIPVTSLSPTHFTTPFLTDPLVSVTSTGTTPLRQVSPNPNTIFSAPMPLTPLPSPTLHSVDPRTLALLGITPPTTAAETTLLTSYLSGSSLPPGSTPSSHCYAGHQFGSFSGQLGDGANLNLGVANSLQLQLKGSGKTPYSRTADGRKVLRSTIREYLGSVFMDRAAVPTTLGLSLAVSDQTIQRDKYYTGQVTREQMAVVGRVAPSFFRFGSFEIFKTEDDKTRRAGPNPDDFEMAGNLYQHIVQTYFPDVASPKEFILEQARTTASLFALWHCIGFTHGVLNTDNMSLHGLTIDYGPYGFQEGYDPMHTPNGSDNGQRYAFEKQREIGLWNLNKLAEVLKGCKVLPELYDKEINDRYDEEYDRVFNEKMQAKLGLAAPNPELNTHLFSALTATQSDFTDTFLALETFVTDPATSMLATLDLLVLACSPPAAVTASCERKLKITRPSMDPRRLLQLWEVAQKDPAQLAEAFGAPAAVIVEELRGEMDKLESYAAVAKMQEDVGGKSSEEKEGEDRKVWRAFLSKYMEALGGDGGDVGTMRRNNPRFVPKNWLLQAAIEKAERGDYGLVEEIRVACDHVYDKEWFDAEDRGLIASNQRSAPAGKDSLYNT